jgi:hypothetical protein
MKKLGMCLILLLVLLVLYVGYNGGIQIITSGKFFNKQFKVQVQVQLQDVPKRTSIPIMNVPRA